MEKKKIDVTLFGQLYNIDEDVYELLSNYKETLRQHFCKQEGGAEIFNDLETRIAELLLEHKLRDAGPITVKHVESIIHRIGKPDEIGNNEKTVNNEITTTRLLSKRMKYIVGLVIAIIIVVLLAQIIHKKTRDMQTQVSEEKIKAELATYPRTDDGTILLPAEMDYLLKNKWKPIANKNNNNVFSFYDRYYPLWTMTGKKDGTKQYLHASGTNKTVYQVERIDTVPPGQYQLSYDACALGKGASVYIKTSQCNERKAIDKGTQWTHYNISVTIKQESVVRYGVLVNPAESTQKNPFRWFSAADFKLECLK